MAADSESTPVFRSIEVSKRATIVALLLTLIMAGGLRLIRLDISPPGMNVDEAGTLWNAWCLYQEGKDQHGVSWPIFRSRVFGMVDNRSPLFQFYMIPFLAVRGFSLETARFSMAVSGLLTILLLYYFAARMYGRATALAAAGLLALLPWHIQQSRWAHGAALQPFLSALPIAAILWARLPFCDSKDKKPRPGRSFVAGLITGGCCYGYPSIRIFLPLFLSAAVLLHWRAWLALLRSRRGQMAFGLFSLGIALTFGPLVWKHLTDPEMNRRGSVNWVFMPNDPPISKVGRVLERYPPHFGLPFLFKQGDRNVSLQGPTGYGVLLWYHLALLTAGAAALAVRWRWSPASRIALLWLLLYPAGDLLTSHPGPHLLRSQPGMLGLVLVCAVGVVAPLEWLWRRRRALAISCATVLTFTALTMTGLYLADFFGSFNEQPLIGRVNQVDFLPALDWLKANGQHYGRVYITSAGIPHPYIYTVVRTEMSPADWFKAEKVIKVGPAENGAHPLEDVYYTVGRYRFIYGKESNNELAELSANGKEDLVLVLVEPGKIRIGSANARLLKKFRRSNGDVAFQAIELVI
ncbi:MAG: glycosyltransferase family 39 protein [Acidobacteria bacterium]|nr:glycosyltransferase family 39 protein [Acidobacteriota bacterium]